MKRKILTLFSIIILVLSLYSCIVNHNSDRVITNNSLVIDSIQGVETKGDSTLIIPEIDTIAIIIEERKCTAFTNTIFAGAVFGMSEKRFTQKKKDYESLYKNHIFINLSSDIEKLRIVSVSPSYYKNKLYELKVSVDGHKVNCLNELFKSKYGETYENTWEYKDVIITINEKSRLEYSPTNSTQGARLYYLGVGSAVTKNQYYTEIYYKSKELENAKLDDMMKQDSLKQLKLQSQKKRDIEKAKLQRTLI